MIHRMKKNDSNISSLRRKYKDGLHWVVGDTHGEAATLVALMKKIKFDPEIDNVYFVGDYNSGGDPYELLKYISIYYQPDYSTPGFHLIRGNHERELFPMYPLENMPDILVIRGRTLNYYITHAGMVSAAFDIINDDMVSNENEVYFAYRLDEKCTESNVPLYQITWSKPGLYSQHSEDKLWPDENSLNNARACIIHGHTPYCFFSEQLNSYYGENSLFWEDQHIWFSEDMHSFDIDSNIKGTRLNDENYRGLACICLEALDDIAYKNGSCLTIKSILSAENFVFHTDYITEVYKGSLGDVEELLQYRPRMKTIGVFPSGEDYINISSYKK